MALSSWLVSAEAIIEAGASASFCVEREAARNPGGVGSMPLRAKRQQRDIFARPRLMRAHRLARPAIGPGLRPLVHGRRRPIVCAVDRARWEPRSGASRGGGGCVAKAVVEAEALHAVQERSRAEVVVRSRRTAWGPTWPRSSPRGGTLVRRCLRRAAGRSAG